jgi:hypothetical protein
LVHFAQIHKKQVAIIVHFHVQFSVLRVGILPDKEPEGKHFLNPDLLALFVDLPDLDGDDFMVDDFHVAFEQRVEILNPWFVDGAGEFGGFE